MTNATIAKFNYPDSLLHEYESWVVLLRPQQVTVGSLILACKLDAMRMSEVTPTAFAELSVVTSHLEGALERHFAYDKINYLLLMMVDKHVHFHVLPRYSTPRQFDGVTFVDGSWPKPPDLSKVVDITPEQYQRLLMHLRDGWPTTR